mgnify:CR=1 FL=1
MSVETFRLVREWFDKKTLGGAGGEALKGECVRVRVYGFLSLRLTQIEFLTRTLKCIRL